MQKEDRWIFIFPFVSLKVMAGDLAATIDMGMRPHGARVGWGETKRSLVSPCSVEWVEASPALPTLKPYVKERETFIQFKPLDCSCNTAVSKPNLFLQQTLAQSYKKENNGEGTHHYNKYNMSKVK